MTDLFTLFHLTFAKKLTTDDYWEQHLNTPVINTWQGLAFESEYVITAEEDRKMRNRMAAFVREAKTRHGILPTWITPYGLIKNEYAASINYQITMDDLFS